MKWIAVFLILLFPATALCQSYRSERYRGYDYYKSFRKQPKTTASMFSKPRQYDPRRWSPPRSCSPYPCREERYDVEIYDHSTGKRERKTITVKPADRRYGWQ
jgi:hypothetical protein